MTHKRTDIRDYLKTALESTSAASVWLTSPYQVEEGQVPSLAITTASEDLEEVGSMGREYYRTMLVWIDIATLGDDPQRAFDVLAEEVEAILKADPTLGGLAVDCTYAGMLEPTIIAAKQKVYQQRLNFNVEYQF